MIPLSHAIRKGAEIAPNTCQKGYFDFTRDTGTDPLGAAYIGHLHPGAVEPFYAMARGLTHDSLCAHMLRGLHRAWPHLGASVRQWPSLAAELERDRLLPRLRTNQPEYRQEIHKSLWVVICDMHDAGATREQVAAYLEGHGL